MPLRAPRRHHVLAPPRPLRGAVVALAIVVGAAGCREAARALGPSPAAARENAGDLLGTLGARFGPNQIDPQYLALRMKFARGALAPSRLVSDSTAWTSVEGSARTLEVMGNHTPTGYRLGVRGDLPEPRVAGEYRRVTQLLSLGRSEYQWHVRDELAVGSTTTTDLGRALDVMLEEAERLDGPAIRASYREGMPRTTAALGRLFTLDSIATEKTGYDATEVTLLLSMHTRRLAEDFPAYAKYLDKYVSPVELEMSLFDDTGERWWTVSARDDRLRLRFRVKGAALAPLDGVPRRMPDRVHAQIDFTMKAMLFRVGVKRLLADVAIDRGERGAGFTARFTHEPEWILPPLVERMIRSPLRRPFAGEGARLTYSVHDGENGRATVAVRDYQLAVRESAIVRWFGKLGNSALSDFRAGAEREADAFVGELWRSVRADALALIPAD